MPTFNLTPRQNEALELLNGPQRHTLLAGGARSGKTFLFTLAILIRALKAENSRHVIFRYRANSVWTSVGLDTLPKVAKILGIPVISRLQDKYFVLPNGSEIWLAGLDEKERVEKILGMEFVTIYFNESSQIPFYSYLIARTRLAQVCPGLKQREYVDLNPAGTGHWTYRMFIQKIDPDNKKPIADPEDYQAFFINPGDNAQNLTPEFLRSLETLPERQRKRFYEGVYINDIDGALWPLDLIEKSRCDPVDLPEMDRIVVAIDPSGAGGEEEERSNEIGIVVAGRGVDGKGYVLADRTCTLSPAAWGRVAVTAYHEFKADRIIAEQNFGGAMVEHVIRTADKNVPFKKVTASRGKAIRAEPISALYEKGAIFHAGRFSELEDQMSNFSTSGYLGDKSPDRVDAMVWAMTELMTGHVSNPSIRRF